MIRSGYSSAEKEITLKNRSEKEINIYRIAVTNRHLCRGGFLAQIEKLAKGTDYDAIVLREKDLPEEDYHLLAEKVISICRVHRKRCILHQYWKTAIQLRQSRIHLPLPTLEKLENREKACFSEIGSSVHSIEQARRAEQLGVTYMTAGHIFSTECKPGLPPKGLDFLREICHEVSVPVYGIGGITANNEESVVRAGAKGVCVMSQSML